MIGDVIVGNFLTLLICTSVCGGLWCWNTRQEQRMQAENKNEPSLGTGSLAELKSLAMQVENEFSRGMILKALNEMPPTADAVEKYRARIEQILTDQVRNRGGKAV